jgi:hypothetical protein
MKAILSLPEVPPEKVLNIQKLEQQLCKRKFRFTPSINHLDPNVFTDFTNTID